MKYISIKFCLVIVALFGVVAGASDLPDCPSDTNVPNVRWHNCFGTYTFSSGSKYVGEFKDGNFNGQGTKTWANGTVEEGIWKNDKFQYANIVSVDSKSASNLPKCPSDTDAQWHNCFGTSTSPNGNKYVGEWKDDKKIGQGTFTEVEGTVTEVMWKDDEFLGTTAELERAEKKHIAKEKQDELVRQEKQDKYDRIYNACLLDKGSNVDMQVNSLEVAVKKTCASIAEKPSWLETLRYE